MEKVIGHLLRKAQTTLAVAESCTGGLIADRLTDVSGSSDYFVFSGVTYSNHSKIDILKVSEETIITYGAVHEETAMQMARGARRITSYNVCYTKLLRVAVRGEWPSTSGPASGVWHSSMAAGALTRVPYCHMVFKLDCRAGPLRPAGGRVRPILLR